MLTSPRFRALALGAVAILVAHLLDGWAHIQWHADGVYDHDRGRMFRIVGYLPLWILLAVAWWLQTRQRRRAILIGLVPALGGLLAEVLKILLRRERPNLHDGAYVFRDFADQFWSTKAIGLPSSHALVAFSGAWMLTHIWPRAWPIWLLLAGGCAFTRVQAGAHFLSDVTVAAVAAYVMVQWIVARWDREDVPASAE